MASPEIQKEQTRVRRVEPEPDQALTVPVENDAIQADSTEESGSQAATNHGTAIIAPR